MNKDFFIETVARLPLDDRGCKIWPYQKHKGYGKFWLNGKGNQIAHRFLYKVLKNPDLPRDLLVMHSCDNPSCVNIDHLSEGTAQDNMDDKMLKGRHVISYNESHGSCHISNTEVNGIKEMYATGLYTQKEIAKKFYTSQSHVSSIVNGRYRDN